MNKDQVKGHIDEAKGAVKEIAGKLVGNEDLEQEGTIQKAAGKVESAYGDLKEDIKKVVTGKWFLLPFRRRDGGLFGAPVGSP